MSSADHKNKLDDHSKRIRALETALIKFTEVIDAVKDHQRAIYGDKDHAGMLEMQRDHAVVINGAMWWLKTFAVAVIGQIVIFGVGLFVLLIRVMPVLIKLSETP